MSVLNNKHAECAWQEGDDEYDPTAADDEFAEANGGGLPQEAAEEEEEAEFDEAAIEDEERNERKLMAGMPVICQTMFTTQKSLHRLVDGPVVLSWRPTTGLVAKLPGVRCVRQ